MNKVAVIYHSAHGHTEHIAQQVAEGARAAGADVQLVKASDATPERLTEFDGFVFGSPTYLGGVSGVFKTFMDTTGKLWRAQALKGKLAAGFTVSSLPAGDKQSTLISLFTFAMQHGMVWIGNPFLPDESTNRLGSWSGLIAQAGHASPADAFPAADVKTARMFGANFAESLLRWSPRHRTRSSCP